MSIERQRQLAGIVPSRPSLIEVLDLHEAKTTGTKVKRKGFVLRIWQNPDVADDSDGPWQGTYLKDDGGWGETKPTSRYGYVSKQELLKHLERLALDLWRVGGRNAPSRVGK